MNNDKHKNIIKVRYGLIPKSQEVAHLRLGIAVAIGVENAPVEVFLSAWWALCWLNPGLHPDDHEGWESQIWREIAREAFKRADNGEISDHELYPAEAVHNRISIERAIAAKNAK